MRQNHMDQADSKFASLLEQLYVSDERRKKRKKKRRTRKETRRCDCFCCRSLEEPEIAPIPEKELDDEEADENDEPLAQAPQLPYRSLDVVFNNKNCWLNKQKQNPTRIWYDLWDTSLWHPLLPQKVNNMMLEDVFHPAFQNPTYQPPMSDRQCQLLKKELATVCMETFSQTRSARSLPTRFNNDEILSTFLERGLKLYHEALIAAEEEAHMAWSKVSRWKSAFLSRLPEDWQLVGQPVIVSSSNADEISETLSRTSDLVAVKSPSAAFFLGCFVAPQVSNNCLVYILLGVARKVQYTEMRRLQQKMQRDRRGGASCSGDWADDEDVLAKIYERERSAFDLEQAACSPENMMDESPQADAAAVAAEAATRTPVSKTKRADEEIGGVSLKSGEVPIKKRRKIKIPSGSEYAVIAFQKQHFYSGEFQDARLLMDRTAVGLSEAFQVPKHRIKVYEIRYRSKRIVFAVTPVEADLDAPDPAEIMQRIAAGIAAAAKTEPDLVYVTGGIGILEWGGPMSTKPPRFQSDAEDEKPSEPKAEKKKAKPKAKKKPVKPAKPLARSEPAKAVPVSDEPAPTQEDYETFYDYINEVQPEKFEKFEKYYKEQGYPEKHARYIAAYYAAVYHQKLTGEQLI